MPATREEVMIKATPLLSVMTFIDGHLQPAQREKVFTALSGDFPEEVKKIRGQRILATERFPVRFVSALIEGMAEELRRNPADLAQEIGFHAAAEASGGMLRLALTMISIPNLLRKLEPVWQQLYTHGHMTSEYRDRSAAVELHDFPYVSATQCGRVTGMFEWFAKKAEKNASVRHTSCRARGDGACKWDIAW